MDETKKWLLFKLFWKGSLWVPRAPTRQQRHYRQSLNHIYSIWYTSFVIAVVWIVDIGLWNQVYGWWKMKSMYQNYVIYILSPLCESKVQQIFQFILLSVISINTNQLVAMMLTITDEPEFQLLIRYCKDLQAASRSCKSQLQVAAASCSCSNVGEICRWEKYIGEEFVQYVGET